MINIKSIYKWIEHNRFIVIAPIACFIIWFVAIGCTALTADPLGGTRNLNTSELQVTFEVWQKEQEIIGMRFEHAAKDLQAQEDQWSKIQILIMKLASGTIATWPGMLQLVMAGGFVGAISDNVRKRGLIAGLKRNNSD